MKFSINKIIVSVFLLLFTFLNGLFSQEITLDWKIHDVGNVRQLITNKGPLWPAGITYPGLINCEYPPNSFEEHIGEAGIWVGAITPSNDTLVTVTSSWNPHLSHYEFWPFSNEPWDTIWVVKRNEIANIPYWPNYIGFSDQDFVCRYNDYNPVSLMDPLHKPLYIDVIQTSHVWSSPSPINDIILFNFYVVPRKFKLSKTYITYWVDPNVGERLSDIQQFLRDDYSMFFPDLLMGVGADAPGGMDGEAYSPIGFKIIPPKGYSAGQLRWTFIWGGSPNPPGITPSRDADKYRELMSAGVIMENQQFASGSHFVISFGPFDLNVDDTLHFQVVEILGDGLEGVLNTARVVDRLAKRNFRFPAPPPSPPLKVEAQNHQIRLIWKPTDKVNPEEYFDPNRADSAAQPFEGYRVYKSTQSITGPWKLLAEYDIKGNEFGHNIGLAYEYIDKGLINNVEYYYSVTAFSKPDTVLPWPSLESSINANAVIAIPGTAPPETIGKVAVVPNPYRGDIKYNTYIPPWERPPASRGFWMEQDRRIQFINLPENCEIKIYTVAGDLVATLQHQDPSRGYEDWNLTSSVGQAVASGIYLFTVEDKKTGDVQVGKFVIIK